MYSIVYSRCQFASILNFFGSTCMPTIKKDEVMNHRKLAKIKSKSYILHENHQKKECCYHSSLMINTCHVYSWMKSNRWWLLRVVLVTEQLQLVDATLMDCLPVEKDAKCKTTQYTSNNWKKQYKREQSATFCLLLSFIKLSDFQYELELVRGFAGLVQKLEGCWKAEVHLYIWIICHDSLHAYVAASVSSLFFPLVND